MLCQRSIRLSPSTIRLGKITLLFAFFCFAECVTGACIRYGHSCWGAHGKRNGDDNRSVNAESIATRAVNGELVNDSDEDNINNGLLVSRIIEQLPRFYKGRRIDMDFSDSDLPKMKTLQLDDGDLQELSLLSPQTNAKLSEFDRREKALDKLRFLNYLKTNAEKLN